MDPELLTREALALPAQERARLAELLLSSLDDLPDQEVERLWVTEAQRRAAEIDGGDVPQVTADQLRQRVRTLLG
jgi:putative addiction module component (TIGR02574 family)